jgi:uncharacterized protein YprB with RNaseH-like and TPR domain
MIRHTFSILQGVGEKIEKRLWMQGILNWEDFINAREISGISYYRKSLYDQQLVSFSDALQRRDSLFFTKALRRREHWRLYNEWKDSVVCLDIETNGFMPEQGGYPTVVGLYDGKNWRALIRGENLTSENLIKELSGYKMVVTFYGSVFDIPFLCKTFRTVEFNLPHFDLCFALKKLGINGGLKKVEERFGISRDESVRGMDGYDAVRLWYEYRRGSKEAIELLLKYNEEDTVNLFQLARQIYHLLRESTGIKRFLIS